MERTPRVDPNAKARLGVAFGRQDPRADAVAQRIFSNELAWREFEAMLAGAPARDPALAALREQLFTPPVWVDHARIALASELMQRAGILGSIVLAMYSLPLGYRSPSGVKPLVFSGRLVEQSPRRLAETNRFLIAVTSPGGMRVGAPGWAIAARVRLVHALVRCKILAVAEREPARWNHARWGAPVNQMHMAGTNLMFSLKAVEGLRKLGLRVTEAEAEATMHLWRYVGHHMGIEDEWLCASQADGWHLWHAIESVTGETDADGRALAQALLFEGVPRALSTILPGARITRMADPLLVPLVLRLSTALMGREDAARLGYPPVAGPLVVAPILRALVATIERLRGQSTRRRSALVHIGGAMNRRIMAAALDGKPAKIKDVA